MTLNTLKKRLTTILPVGKKLTRYKIIGLLAVCLLLSGFSWTWVIEFTTSVIFPFDEAIHTGIILNFDELVNLYDLKIYLTDPLIAEQLVDGLRANLSAQVYNDIELPDMREESLGRRIIRIIFDRLFA